MNSHSAVARQAHMRLLVEQIAQLEERLRAGGGTEKIDKQHRAGKADCARAHRRAARSRRPFP